MNVYVFSSKEIPLMPSHMGNIPVIGYMVKCSTKIGPKEEEDVCLSV
jgi:hypothetical protein